MGSLIVAGVVIAFLLLMLPAVIVPFLPWNPSSVTQLLRPTIPPSGPDAVTTTPPVSHPSDRIAA